MRDHTVIEQRVLQWSTRRTVASNFQRFRRDVSHDAAMWKLFTRHFVPR